MGGVIDFDVLLEDGARVVFGQGAEARVASLLRLMGARRVLAVCTPRRRQGADRIAEALGSACVGVFAEATTHVPQGVADAARGVARTTRCDWVLAHGGGSAVGVAKAVALEVDVRIAAVPTTYAGSERTSIWGITTSDGKTTGRALAVLPRLAVYDPALTVGVSLATSQQSLLNALAHSVEALYATQATDSARRAAKESLQPLMDGLERVSVEATDPGARTVALHGAYLAASALGGASMALHHKLAHVIGGTFSTPHASTHAVLLPHTMAYNLPASSHARRALRPVLGEDPPAELWDRMRRLGIPTGLAALRGPVLEDLDAIARAALRKRYSNPREVTRDGLRTMLRRMWHDQRPSLHDPNEEAS